VGFAGGCAGAAGNQRPRSQLQAGALDRPDHWFKADGLPFYHNGFYPPEAYVGVLNTIGLDIGITAGGVMAWGVIAPPSGPFIPIER
jgi:Protein of unknown function (DUF992)